MRPRRRQRLCRALPSLEGVDCAKRHLIVIRADDHASLEGAGLDPVLGDRLALGAVPLTRLSRDDFHARILSYYIVTALGTEDSSLVCNLSLKNDNITFAASQLGKLLHLDRARVQESEPTYGTPLIDGLRLTKTSGMPAFLAASAIGCAALVSTGTTMIAETFCEIKFST